ncbi:hypothetical protein AX774_g2195 [Zancudomyces culisetae]|uniref:Altered inheritance of mitochondria protein 24, mitochondrial n=1 Tax=Zancudomyces culisetae TaxID=1213189 RepID=A0A1R1PTG2_ZANCU|nr:hypothetical protein AX774_g2195 [Zancudomyces culisetae]|eukprot:OMH84285.1 hypothetical protein AX774_g2195 [Zancudomyces culisetae]
MAYTSLITIKSVLGLASNLGSGFLKFDKVSGNGTVVFASRGGLHRLSLSENEEYLVNSKHVVAWDSNVNIKRDEDEPVVRKLWKYGQFDKTASSVGSPTQKQEQESKVATKKPYLQRITEYFKTRATRLLTFIKNGSLASVQYLSVYLWDLLKLYLWRTRRYIRNGFNSTVFFRVCGPGDVYLTSTTTKSIYDSVSQRLTSSK